MPAKTQPLSRSIRRANRWRERYNPLRGLTAEQARALLESYLTGQATDLMWALTAPMIGVESADPDLLALIERRTARLMEMDWDIHTAADAADRGRQARAERQAAALREAYDKFGNLYAAVQHLSLAPFRGWAHVEVAWDGGYFELIPPWAVVRDGMDGGWAYNPEARQTAYQSLGEGDRVDPKKHWWLIRTVDRPIAAWALLKYFFQALSQRDWASFCSIYGIPGGVVVGPPTVPEEQRGEFESAAREIAAGGSGYLPHGSEWRPNTDARGTQPFRDWLDYLSEKLILAGTGGKLTMLNDPTGLGSGQSASHDETFEQLARAEARAIAEIMHRQFDKRVLAAAGLLEDGERPLAWWQLAANEETDVGEIIDHAGKLRLAGLRMDTAELSEKTGYTLTEEPVPSMPPSGGPPHRSAIARDALQNDDRGSAPVTGRPLPVRPLSARLADYLSRLESAGPDAPRALIEEGLALLDTLTPEDLGSADLAADLEARLMEAVIRGAASAAGKSGRGGRETTAAASAEPSSSDA